MGNYPRITCSKDLDLITVHRGETLTVYLRADTAWQHEEGVKNVAIEVRVNPDGTPEVFLDDNLTARSFDDWAAMPDN